MTTVDLSQAEIADLIQAMGGKFRTQPFTANERLALRGKLEAVAVDERSNRVWNPSVMGEG